MDKNFFVSGQQTQKRPMSTPTIFLSLFFRLQEHTNSTILMDARQGVGVLPLFLLFVPCVFDNHNTTK